MPIQLDKILEDIADERALHPYNTFVKKEEVDDAWSRVGKKNKLSIHEARSIFKVLQKKYEQEKAKGNSAWKLFNIMSEIHMKEENDSKSDEENDFPVEEEEEFEMLDVQEDDECGSQSAEGLSKSISPEKEDTKIVFKTVNTTKTGGATIKKNSPNGSPVEEKKLLNTLASSTPKSTIQSNNNATLSASALRQKGIIVKKTSQITSTNTTNNANTKPTKNVLECGKTLHLPESIKRKLSEDQNTQSNKKVFISNTSHNNTQSRKNDDAINDIQLPNNITPGTSTVTTSSSGGINIITISGRSDLVNGTTKPVNSLTSGIEDIDLRNGNIIFETMLNDSTTATHTSNNNNNVKLPVAKTGDIIDLGNFDNSLPPTFFKNLCNSKRHESLGLYVANVMNRLSSRAQSKLEIAILSAIIDAQNSELLNDIN